MAFTFAAFCYMLTLVLCASLIFFIIWHVSSPIEWVTKGMISIKGQKRGRKGEGIRDGYIS
uniref:Uncharacterized protein n=1 Tax=Leptobrachium leishanense TaxID=445787 RepID=A0A8C5Q783_9ANUR